MATLRAKGARDDRRVYVRWQVGSGETRRQCERLLPGIRKVSEPDARDELARVERDVAEGRDPFPAAAAPTLLGPLLEQWRDSLTNRSSDDDRSRLRKHVLPYWKDIEIGTVTIRSVMDWIDHLKGIGTTQTQRHVLNIMSRFFDWAIMRDLAQTNPVKLVPSAAKPIARPLERSWIQENEDATVTAVMEALPADLALMFYIANRSGLRTGEAAGLTMGDMDWIGQGKIRVAHSWGGPLKEDRRGTGKLKWAPAPDDLQARMRLHLGRRRLAGAGPEDLVFVAPVRTKGRMRKTTWLGYRYEFIRDRWQEASKAAGIDLTWYESSRHSMVSRHLNAGESLDEVSAAVGHANIEVTRSAYAHMLPRDFSAGLRRGIKSVG
jgi:integrase